MAVEVIMPALGMAQETGKVLRWHKSEGDDVKKGEPLLEVETDKVTVDVEAPADGTLASVSASEGDEVPVGQAIAFVLAAGEQAPARPEQRSNGASGSEPQTRDGAPRAAAVAAPPHERRRPLASPKARRLAAERDIDLASIAGSGPHGAVIAADVDKAPEEARELVAQSHKVGPAPEIGTVWKRMAAHTTESWQSVPHFFLQRELDASRLNAWRESARARSGYERVSHTDLLVKVSAAALARHPRVTARWEDGTIVPGEGVNVAIAVATEDGLIAPVVHGADRLTLREIVERRTQLVEAARAGRLRLDDISGGTFTISNLGMYGVDSFQAIVNAPQAAILAAGRILDRVVPVDGSPVVRPTLSVTLSFDHRVVDGARGAEFLDTLAALAEEPVGLVD